MSMNFRRLYHSIIEVLKYGLGKRQRIAKAPGSCGGACAGRADFFNLVFKKEIAASAPVATCAKISLQPLKTVQEILQISKAR